MNDFILSISGLVPSYVKSMTLGARKVLIVMAYTMHISSSFSGFMLARTIDDFLHPQALFILLWLPFTVIVFMLERLILISDLSQKLMIWLRVLLALVVAFITSMTVEMNFFSRTAENQMKEVMQDSLNKFYESHDKKIAPLIASKSELQKTYNTNLGQISEQRTDFDNEILSGNSGKRLRGPGPVSSVLYASFQQDSILIERKNEAIQDQIKYIDSKLTKDSLYLEHRITAMKSMSFDDPIKQMEAIHTVVYKSSTSIFFYVVIHLFFIFLELFVLIGKYSNISSFQEYYNVRAADLQKRSKKKDYDNVIYEADLLKDFHKENIDKELESIKHHGDAKLMVAREQIAFLRNYSNIADETLTVLDETNLDAKTDLKEQYQNKIAEELKSSSNLFQIK